MKIELKNQTLAIDSEAMDYLTDSEQETLRSIAQKAVERQRTGERAFLVELSQDKDKATKKRSLRAGTIEPVRNPKKTGGSRDYTTEQIIYAIVHSPDYIGANERPRKARKHGSKLPEGYTRTTITIDKEARDTVRALALIWNETIREALGTIIHAGLDAIPEERRRAALAYLRKKEEGEVIIDKSIE